MSLLEGPMSTLRWKKSVTLWLVGCVVDVMSRFFANV
jgi:hypothetical protein